MGLRSTAKGIRRKRAGQAHGWDRVRDELLDALAEESDDAIHDDFPARDDPDVNRGAERLFGYIRRGGDQAEARVPPRPPDRAHDAAELAACAELDEQLASGSRRGVEFARSTRTVRRSTSG